MVCWNKLVEAKPDAQAAAWMTPAADEQCGAVHPSLGHALR